MKKRPSKSACFKNRSSERVRLKKRSTAMYKNSSWSFFEAYSLTWLFFWKRPFHLIGLLLERSTATLIRLPFIKTKPSFRYHPCIALPRFGCEISHSGVLRRYLPKFFLTKTNFARNANCFRYMSIITLSRAVFAPFPRDLTISWVRMCAHDAH